MALVRAIPGWWRLLAIPAAWALLELVLFAVTMRCPEPSGQSIH